MVAKSPEAFRTISEVAEELDLPQHVLRFWETRFTQIRPLKRGGGRRYYRPEDIDLLRGIRFFLYGEGYTIRGVQRILKEQGPRFVSAAGRGEIAGPPGHRVTSEDLDDDADGDVAPALPRRREPAFAESPRLPVRPDPDFDVAREDHDPDEDLPEQDEPLALDEDEDDEDIGDDARRLAARFAPRPPDPEPRRAPPPLPRGEPPRARAEAPPRPERAPQPPAAGLADDDAETLRTTLAELLDLKRILDQARSTER